MSERKRETIDTREKDALRARRPTTMYTQYFSRNDFSRAASTGLPSAVTGGGTRSAGLSFIQSQ